MRVKGIVIEDFVNYKLPCMFVATCFCDWKCCNGIPSRCQNYSTMDKLPILNVPKERIWKMYEENDITSALVFGGLEPMLQFEEVLEVIHFFRMKEEHCPIIIYSGYEREELKEEISFLSKYDNIILKLGRYIPNRNNKFDELLGVTLSSDNQYAIEVINCNENI